MPNNTNKLSIQEQLRKQALRNAGKQDLPEEETVPSWISPASWWIGGIVAFVVKIAIIANIDRRTPEDFFAPLGIAIVAFFLVKVCSYAILEWLCSAAKSAKTGAKAVAQASSKKFDSITSAVTEKVTKAIENGKNNAKLENEKELLKQKVNDLEIQQLKQRISDLEKQLKDKQ